MFGWKAFFARRAAKRAAEAEASHREWLRDYPLFIHRIASVSGPSEVVLTRSRESVEIIATEIFRQAHTHVYLYGAILDLKSSGNEDLIATIAGFVSRSPEAKIIFTIPLSCSTPSFSQELISHELIGRHVVIARPKGEELPERSQLRFIASDDGSYWFGEHRSGFQGIAQFHEKEKKMGDRLIQIINRLYIV